MQFQKQAFRALAASAAILATCSPAIAQQRNWDWSGGRAGDREYRLVGAGVPLLHRELRNTNRGRAFVMRNFDTNRDGRINRREAERANRVFIEIARPSRGGFDWSSRDEVVVVPDRGGDWDRGAMRNYRFRQTPLGATMTLQEDVLFRTDSADLRQGAIEKLRPLAGYLRANSGVRVAIIGHTDSRGSDAHNQVLSERRADSVRSAFDEMGVTRARFRVEGHGEREPVATNNTPEGMRLNRRVEVTLLGQRADRFDRDN
ncbi:OmpA family protein [Sphingomonas psychrotolerans]|uniref:Flagellar motor protein MotB n=1 Tax=Sphingomonas psychrotolerans TaxID=1327635 RepID=A0A2K8MJV1_9SPHN|nr:OmpA family protein [Sphingomonas psychrotolerans]ATY34147.1 flagellar motor protein MotB [Sphingomonas psychrotolerans]